MDDNFTETGYKNLMEAFLQSGYSFELFDGKYSDERVVYLRHDIDFSVEFAYEMALIDQSLGISSTFFFLPNSELYNLYSKRVFELINGIIEMGHDVCLHIDLDVLNNLETAIACFKMYYPHSNASIISFHQPKGIPPNYCLPEGMINVYSSQFFSEIEYASDSGGEWKYGYPLFRPAFKQKTSFQLLTHPLWWMSLGGDINNAIYTLVDKIHNNTMQALSQFRFIQKH